jgi:hypothetical protein
VSRTYDALASVTLTAAASSISITGIPQNYTDLRVVAAVFQPTGSAQQAMLRVNNDSGTNYSLTYLDGDGSSAATGRLSNQTQVSVYYTPPGGTSAPIVSTIDFFSYANTNLNKTWFVSGASGSSYVFSYVSLWRSTAAVNRIDLNVTTGGNFQPGSTVQVFGVRAES